MNKMKGVLILFSVFPLILCLGQKNNSATISYTLWVGSLPENGTVTIYNINITTSKNASFYQVMELAAAENSAYKFKAKNYDFGHYITQIGDYHETPSLNTFWMIYKLPTLPNPWKIPSDEYLTPKGVDETFIKNGEHYLFWLHKLKSLEH